MERVLTMEERIKRAEEIYERRKNNQSIPKSIENIKNKNDKKDIKILKKLIIQLVLCIVIDTSIYIIQTKNYPITENFIRKVNEILSYDEDFINSYNICKARLQDFSNQITQKLNKNENENAKTNDEMDETNEKNIENKESQNSKENNKNTANINLEEPIAVGGATEENVKVELSQADQDAINAKNTTSFIKPINGTITSKFGQRNTNPKNHTGTDIAANLGTKIISSTDGEVVVSSTQGDYGKHLKIQIGSVSIIYAHCNKLYVKQGDKVNQGQEIAEVGTTGNSTGPHLHFEIRYEERVVDPERILPLAS